MVVVESYNSSLIKMLCVISGFRYDANEIFGCLGCYAVLARVGYQHLWNFYWCHLRMLNGERIMQSPLIEL